MIPNSTLHYDKVHNPIAWVWIWDEYWWVESVKEYIIMSGSGVYFPSCSFFLTKTFLPNSHFLRLHMHQRTNALCRAEEVRKRFPKLGFAILCSDTASHMNFIGHSVRKRGCPEEQGALRMAYPLMKWEQNTVWSLDWGWAAECVSELGSGFRGSAACSAPVGERLSESRDVERPIARRFSHCTQQAPYQPTAINDWKNHSCYIQLSFIIIITYKI